MNGCVCMSRELRELAVRGVDGPGMSILDLASDSYKHVPSRFYYSFVFDF